MTADNYDVKQCIFIRRHNGRLKIGLAALTELHRHRQSQVEALEAGGVLLGRYIQDSDDIVVDRVTTPMSGDRRSRVRFFRSRAPHQAEIHRAWRESSGTSTYLGEWHTHPESYPRPSRTDRLDWQRKVLRGRFTDSIFFVIVGTADLRVWEGCHCGLPMRLPRA